MAKKIFPQYASGFGRNLKSSKFKFLRIGQIVRVDYETGYLDVDWLDDVGGRTNIYLPSAFGGPRGTIRGMPELGSVVVCGWIKYEQNIEKPVILGYLDLNTKNSYEYRLDRGKGPLELTDISKMKDKIGYEIIRHKRRKLYPGEIQIESTQGSELFVDDNLYLSNSKLNEIEILADDQSIRMSSKQNYISTNAGKIWNGAVVREILNGREIVRPVFYANGHRVQYISDSTDAFTYNGSSYTEYRIELQEKTDYKLNVNEFNSGMDVNYVRPFLSFVLGTTVGNDKTDLLRYGYALRPQVFATPNEYVAQNDEIICSQGQENLAGAFKLVVNRTNIVIDKEGHLFTSLASSSNLHPLGSGRSWEGNFDGAIKWLVGKTSLDSRSIIIDTMGSVIETLGLDIEKKSKKLTTQGAIYIRVTGADDSGIAYRLQTVGNEDHIISGNVTFKSTNILLQTDANLNENINGAKSVNVLANQNTIIGKNDSLIVIGDQKIKIGKTRDVLISAVPNPIALPPFIPTPATVIDNLHIIMGTKKEIIDVGSSLDSIKTGSFARKISVAGNITDSTLLGNIVEKITTGSKKVSTVTGSIETSTTTGNIKETIVTGNSAESITTGNKKIEVKTGNIEIKTSVGKININSTTQEVTLEGMLKAKIKSGVTIELVAPTVSIGQLPTKGNVVLGLPGVPTHVCAITGLPFLGSATVTASI